MIELPDPASRLRAAREGAGYPSAAAAARAMEWKVGTYRHHENGTRNITVEAAHNYARSFRVSVAWILGLEDKAGLSYAEEIQSLLYTKNEVDSEGEYSRIAQRDYGAVMLKKVQLSHLADAINDGENDGFFALDASVIEAVAPGRSSTPLTFFAVEVDTAAVSDGIKEGAILLVDRAAALFNKQGSLMIYTYAGMAGAHTMFSHPDETIELLGVGPAGASIRVGRRDLLPWGEVIWIGQSV